MNDSRPHDNRPLGNRVGAALGGLHRSLLARTRSLFGWPSKPTLEFRIPMSPTDSNMRMVRYFLESVQEFGGPIAKAARCVCSVGADEPPRDLKAEYPWTKNHRIDFRWVDREQFRRWTYDATGFDRLWVRSNADVVALIDADLLVAGDFDDVIRQAYDTQTMLGFIAHVSPFGFTGIGDTPSDVWWSRIYEEAGLETPELTYQHTGWGLDWETALSTRPVRILSKDPKHKYCPPYFNYGVVIGPRAYVDKMGETFVGDLEAVCRVADKVFRSQIANCVAFERHGIPCGALPINYNFPMNLPGDAIRALNPDPDGRNRHEDIKIFHYISGREHFETADSVQQLIARKDLDGAWPAFQAVLATVAARIGES